MRKGSGLEVAKLRELPPRGTGDLSPLVHGEERGLVESRTRLCGRKGLRDSVRSLGQRERMRPKEEDSALGPSGTSV